MKTFGQLTDEVLAHLRSYVRDQEASTHLTASVASTTTSLAVDDASILSRGRIEIDDELIWITEADQQTNLAAVPPYGRGMDGTIAAAHASGARVIGAPLFPRSEVQSQINRAITIIGGTLWGVDSVVLTPSSTTFAYELPAAVKSVLSVQMVDVNDNVTYLRNWTPDYRAPAAISATGRAIYLNEYAFYGVDTFVVTYSRDPVQLSDAADLWSDTLLPDSAEDIPVLLAASRLLATAESYRSQTQALEAGALNQGDQAGSLLNQSKYLYGLYQQRLTEERARLLNDTPVRVHYSR